MVSNKVNRKSERDIEIERKGEGAVTNKINRNLYENFVYLFQE